MITGHSIERGFLILAAVNIGEDCNLATLSVIMPGTSLDHGVTLEAMSMVPFGAALPHMTKWEGSPVLKAGPSLPTVQSTGRRSSGIGSLAAVEEGRVSTEDTPTRGRSLYKFTVGAVELFGFVISLAATYVAILPMGVGAVYLWSVSPALVAVTLGFGVVVAPSIYMVQAVLLKWIFLGRCVPGRYDIRSAYGLRFYLAQYWLTSPLARAFNALYADTHMMSLLLRMLGADLGDEVILLRLSPVMLAGADQLHLGDYAALGYGAAVLGATTVGDTLLIAPTAVETW